MKILAISDIHSSLNKLKPIQYKNADMLIVAGDLTNIGLKIEMKEVLDKIDSFKHIKHKIIVLGNHDAKNFHNTRGLSETDMYDWCRSNYPNLTFLNNQIVEVEGLKIYGTAWNSGYKNMWAFEYNLDNRKELTCPRKEVDIIITHEPPSSYNLSYIDPYCGEDLGNPSLRNWLEDNKCKLLICGHLHELSGVVEYINECKCVNVAERLTEEEVKCIKE